jgi:hypothetical protein
MRLSTNKFSLSVLVGVLIASHLSWAATTTWQTDTAKLGRPNTNDKILTFDLNKGAANPAIKANGTTGNIQFASDGATYLDIGSGVSYSAYGELLNLGVSATVTTNALTVALKDQTGAAPSSGSPVNVGFRSTSATGGTSSRTSFTAATSITLAAADSIGVPTSGVGPIYIYLISDSTPEICLSYYQFTDNSLKSASALTGGADTDGTKLWCTSAHTLRPVRLIGQITALWNNPNWSSPTEVTLAPLVKSDPVSWSGHQNCYWYANSTTWSDFSGEAPANCGFVEDTNFGFGTVVPYADGSNYRPGITWTPAETGPYHVIVSGIMHVSGGYGEVELADTAGTPVEIDFFKTSNTSSEGTTFILHGIYRVIDLTAKTLRLRYYVNNSSYYAYVGTGTNGRQLKWEIIRR